MGSKSTREAERPFDTAHLKEILAYLKLVKEEEETNTKLFMQIDQEYQWIKNEVVKFKFMIPHNVQSLAHAFQRLSRDMEKRHKTTIATIPAQAFAALHKATGLGNLPSHEQVRSAVRRVIITDDSITEREWDCIITEISNRCSPSES